MYPFSIEHHEFSFCFHRQHPVPCEHNNSFENFMYSETCNVRSPHRATESVQMYRNGGSCYCNSGLLSEVNLSSCFSLIRMFSTSKSQMSSILTFVRPFLNFQTSPCSTYFVNAITAQKLYASCCKYTGIFSI